MDSEHRRITAVYNSYRDSGRQQRRWADDAPGNRCILRDRAATMQQLLAGRPTPERVLEVGCGSGTVADELRVMFGPGSRIHGADLLFDRLVTALRSGLQPVQADGRILPFPGGQFDLVAVYTVFSSILDPGTRAAMASEILRVLSPTGAVLWYDMRYPSPNRSVRPLGRSSIRRLFPDLRPTLLSTTVLPPLARRLGRFDRSVYPALNRVPAARSHLIGVLERPAEPT